MKTFIHVVILVTFAAAISTYAGAESGTLSFLPEEEPITQTCYNNYQSGTPSVLADSTVYADGTNCGKLVKIVCDDASACTPGNYIFGVITSMCTKVQCSTFTLTSGDYQNFATGAGAPEGASITYSFY